MIRAKENADAGNVGVLESKSFRLGSGDGFFLYPNHRRTLSQLFEPCLSCGHIAVCKVCRGCVEARGLIG